VPKRRSQAYLLEYITNLFHTSPMKVHGQAVVVPKFGKIPNLIDREYLTMFEMISLAPLINPFFRPEEQHRRSSKDQIIIPMGEWHRKVDK
jgi:hypothetical protein